MHACFHGGGGGRIRSIGIIRDLTKNMKAMSLKVKMAGNHGRARRRRRGRRPEDSEDEEELETQGKDIATAPSASAKIAPAQPQEPDGHEEATTSGCGGDDREQRGKTRQEHRDKRGAGAQEDEDEEFSQDQATEIDREWVAEPEPGVLMTLVARPDGTNHLRRIRFSEELFDGHREAQRWWEEHYDAIVELYSVVQPDHDGDDEDESDSVPATPCQSEDDDHRRRRNQQGSDSASNFSEPSSGSGSGSGGRSASTVGSPILGLVTEPGGGGARANQTEHSPT